MTIKVALFGVSGRMGRALLNALRDEPDLKLSGALVSPASKRLGVDAGEICGGTSLGVIVTADREQALAGADVVIDFTLAYSVPDTLRACAAHHCPLVLGTTSLPPETLAQLRACAAQVPIVYSPNMSIGVNVMFALLVTAARSLGPGFEVDILDVHHRTKVDAPSGTALKLGESIASARGQEFAKVAVVGGQVAEARKSGQIVFTSVREGDQVGEHRVTFAGPGESLTLTHRATDRSIYARGALRAARWLAGRTPGLYSMADIV
jgi:4-hydroxy-tetrahydrodipicolinate reductase